MTDLSQIYLAMLTKDESGAGTDSGLILSIDRPGQSTIESTTLQDRRQRDYVRGAANLYQISVNGLGINPPELNDSSIRIANPGDDKWAPEHVIVWGEIFDPLHFPQRRTRPVAIATDIEQAVSNDSDNPDEGILSFPVPLVETFSDRTLINRVVIVMATDGVPEGNGITEPSIEAIESSEEDLELQITTRQGETVANFVLVHGDTAQNDRDAGQANMYVREPFIPFKKADLSSASIRLSINGPDSWLPESFFVFGLDQTGKQLIPLVHLPEWPFGFMSSQDLAEITLPLIQGAFIEGGTGPVIIM